VNAILFGVNSEFPIDLLSGTKVQIIDTESALF
jgi:hypothetical protein